MIFHKHHEVIGNAVRTAFDRAVQEVVGDAKEKAPVSVSRGIKLNAGDLQGGLRASITFRMLPTGNHELKAQIGSSLRYAAMREFGGTIYPVRAQRLAWRDPVTGGFRVAKSVTQKPGGPRQGYQPWLRPAGDKFNDYMGDHLAAL